MGITVEDRHIGGITQKEIKKEQARRRAPIRESRSYLEYRLRSIAKRVFQNSDFDLTLLTSDVDPFIGLEFIKKRELIVSLTSTESFIESHYAGWKFHVSIDIRELKAE